MRKLIVSLVAAVASLAAGEALAQGDGTGARGPEYGPVPGTPEYYGNSGGSLGGMTPQYAPPPYYRDRDGTFIPYGYRDSRPAYPYERPRRIDRDRDGDGVPDRRDRYPDDPRRY